MNDPPNYECYPLRSLQELLDWNPNEEDTKASQSVAELVRHQIKEGPRVLLCHDMKGGYLADRYLHGSDELDAYRFFHWSQIDLFVYFSHHFVTIPPVPWITAGHRNGVLVLGTLITEGLDGYNTCRQLLTDPALMTRVLDQLERIMRFFQFDGWLLNIENQIDQIPELLSFINQLRSRCRQVHATAQLIWYDSVITKPDRTFESLCGSSDDRDRSCSGQLCWQNELNPFNYKFFEHCDGIYLNYAWNDSKLVESRSLAERAGRPLDVYVGVDVFGRGCFGGGGMRTNEALAKIAEHRLSVALFAPGWVHEQLSDLEQFTQLEYDFWHRLSLPIRHVPCRLPIISTFCQGFGRAFFRKGFRLRESAWHNLHLQQVQPNHRCGQVYVHDAFEGGGCLHMRHFEHALIECAVRIVDTCLITIVFKHLPSSQTKDYHQTSSPGESNSPSSGRASPESPLMPVQDPFVRLQQRLQRSSAARRSHSNLSDSAADELNIRLIGTNELNVRSVTAERVAADERLHRHLQALEVTLLEINGWHSRCFEITQAHHWPAVLQQVFVLPPIESSRDGLLIGKLTISCLDNDKHVTGHDDIDQNNSDATQSPVITITST